MITMSSIVDTDYWKSFGKNNIIKYEISKLNNLWHGKVKLYDTKCKI